MQILVGLILAINSLYAIALAAGASLNLKPLLESARRELDDLRRFVEKAPKDTEDRINATLHAMVSATKQKPEGWGFAEGDPIIYL